MILRFGKYKNKNIDDVPIGYLEWLLANVADLNPLLRGAINDRLARTSTAGGPTATASSPAPSLVAIPEVAQAIRSALKEVRRELAQKYHPDHGGSNEAMIAVNEFYERLAPTLLARICMLPPATAGRKGACKAFVHPPGALVTTHDGRDRPIAPVPHGGGTRPTPGRRRGRGQSGEF